MKLPGQSIHAVDNKETSLTAPRKIRVLLVITVLGTGGATNVVLNIARYLQSHDDFDVEILTGPIPDDRYDLTRVAHEQGIPVRTIPSLINFINPLENAKAVVDIRRVIIQGNYDIVHTHSSVAGVVGRLAARLAGNCAIIHHVHGWGLQTGMSSVKRTLYLGLERFCVRFTDRLIIVARPDIQKGLDHRIGRKDKYTLIYNGIELEKFQESVDVQKMRAEMGLEPDSKLVGMIGRLDEQKNPLDFIRAADSVAQRYANVQFLIVGDGVLRPECEQLIRERKLERKIFLLGYRDDVHRILPTLAIIVLSSLWEGLPIVSLEAMSAGKPIVANDVDGVSEVVITGETGFLVSPHQPLEMAEYILTLLNNEKLCNEMGQVAQQRSGDFSVQRMVGQIEALYREVVHLDPVRP